MLPSFTEFSCFDLFFFVFWPQQVDRSDAQPAHPSAGRRDAADRRGARFRRRRVRLPGARPFTEFFYRVSAWFYRVARSRVLRLPETGAVVSSIRADRRLFPPSVSKRNGCLALLPSFAHFYRVSRTLAERSPVRGRFFWNFKLKDTTGDGGCFLADFSSLLPSFVAFYRVSRT